MVLMVFSPNLGGQELRLESTSAPAEAPLYHWTVAVVGDEATIPTIRYVEYTLPPPTAAAVQRITDRNTHFACVFTAAVNAVVVAKIVYTTGQSDTIVHELIADDNQIEPAPGKYGKITTNNSATYVGKDRWNWTVFIQADDRTLYQIQCVEYHLHPTFPEPVQKVCTQGSESGKGFFLTANGWGTFTVKLNVIFKDGERIRLNHDLVFKK